MKLGHVQLGYNWPLGFLVSNSTSWNGHNKTQLPIVCKDPKPAWDHLAQSQKCCAQGAGYLNQKKKNKNKSVQYLRSLARSHIGGVPFHPSHKEKYFLLIHIALKDFVMFDLKF
jgi:hypothetical protein